MHLPPMFALVSMSDYVLINTDLVVLYRLVLNGKNAYFSPAAPDLEEVCGSEARCELNPRSLLSW